MLADFATVVEQGTRDEALLASIAWERLPRHVAIIMDGNGRWAARRGQPAAPWGRARRRPASRGPPRGRRGRPRSCGPGRAPGPTGAHALRLLDRELEAP